MIKVQTIEDFVRNSVEDLIGKKGSILEVTQDAGCSMDFWSNR